MRRKSSATRLAKQKGSIVDAPFILKTKPLSLSSPPLLSYLQQQIMRVNILRSRNRLASRIILPFTMLGLGLTRLPFAAFAMGGGMGGSKPVGPMKK